MRVKQVIGLVILFFGPFSIPSRGQVVAFWTDGNGNWSNSANWSTLTVPNNGGGITYTAVIGPNVSVTFDASGTVVSTLELSGDLHDDGHSPTLTVGNLLAGQASGSTLNLGNRSTLTVTGSMDGGFESRTNINGGSLLSIGGDYTTSGAFDFLTVTDSTLRVHGSVVYQESDLFLDRSKAVIGGDLTDVEGDAVLSASSLNARGFSVIGGEGIIKNGSTLTVGGLGVSDGGFDLDATSSATVGDFGVAGGAGEAFAQIDGTLLVKGTMVSGSGATTIINGLASVHAIQNDGDITVNGKLEVNGGGLVNNGFGTLTISGITNVTGGVSAFGLVSVNPGGTFTADSYISGNTDVLGTLSTASYQSVGNTVIESGGIISAATFKAPTGEVRVFGVANVTGDFTNGAAFVLVNPGATITAGSYSQSSTSLTDVLGTISTASYKQNGGDTIIESGGTISATTFKATDGTVTVNGTLDPTAVEIGSGATLQGTGKIVGNVSMGGTMIPGGPGAPGTVTIFGNYEQTGNGVLREFISSSSSGLLNVSGDVALDSDSILSITLIGGFNPLGDTFTIMDYASLVGQFSNGSSFWDDGFLWDVNYRANQIDISAVRSPEPSSLLLLCIGFAVLALCAQQKIAKTPLLA